METRRDGFHGLTSKLTAECAENAERTKNIQHSNPTKNVEVLIASEFTKASSSQRPPRSLRLNSNRSFSVKLNRVISELLCQTIHREGCPQKIAPEFAFCPTCGRPTVGLHIATLTPHLTLAAGQKSLRLPLNIIGQRGVVLRARVAREAPVRFQAPEGAVESLDVRVPAPATLAPMTIDLPLLWTGEAPPPVDVPCQIALEIITHDGAPLDGFDERPTNHARPWKPLHLRISSPRPAQLEIESALILLGGRARQRELILSNAGEAPLQLQPPLAPVGFEIEADNSSHAGWTLAAGERRSWKIRALPNAPTGETRVPINDSAGAQLGEFRLLVPALATLTARTRHVIGVDFGTSGTSIYKRDGRDDRLPAVALADKKARAGIDPPRRFPTVLYIAFRGGHESGFYIGYEAQQKQQQKEGDRPGLWVREIKSLLRTDREPFVAEFGPAYRVDLLLRRFLQKLYGQIIAPQLEDGGAATVAWNFSLPVLDSHEGGGGQLFELQKQRLESAIRDAGYVKTGDVLEFFTEPFCAAVYLLLGHGNYRYPNGRPPQEGDWACIFDSGGGTTDVVLGRIRLEQGQMRFEEVSTLGGYRENGANGVTTFGGELLTRKTAIYLSVWQREPSPEDKSYQLVLHEVARLSRQGALGNRDPKTVGDDLRTVAALAANNEELFLQPTVTLGTRMKPNPWLEFTQIWDDVERYKRQLASLALPGATTDLPFPSREGDGKTFPVRIVRREFDEVVVNKRLASMGEAMRSQVFGADVATPVEVKWVFGVGGNCRVRRVQDWLHEFFGQSNSVQELTMVRDGVADESDRMLAVAGGAVWANKASRDNTLPYDLRVERAGAIVFEALAHTPITDVAPRETICALRLGQSAEFRCVLSGHVAGDDAPIAFAGEVGRFVVVNRQTDEKAASDEAEARNLTVRIGLEGRTLCAWSDESGALAEIFAFNF